ncbi:ACP S-malonyltransferase [Paenibacillus sp. TSA_86.1]|uniref:ACP S-malonyltransferase n=1 Tax=Paenibacillus sp. TSA_86.1 TaxID=3415649 RepID=UPI004045AB77
MTICALFPGQGSQYIGMCSDLLNNEPEAMLIFAEASEVVGFDLRTLILAGSLEQLTQSEYAQPAVLTASYARFDSFVRRTGITPDYAIGHSLGEIAALVAAGALKFGDAVRFTAARGALMHQAIQEQKGRAGIVVDMSQAELESIVTNIRETHYVTISGYNSPNQFVVAGEAIGLRLLDDIVDRAGGEFIPFRMMPMKADAPYHSELMQFIQPEMEAMVSKLSFFTPEFSICSTVNGKFIRETEEIPRLLTDQLLQPIHWIQALAQVQRMGATTWMDVGPSQSVRNMLAEYDTSIIAYSLDDPHDHSKLLEICKAEIQTYRGGEAR